MSTDLRPETSKNNPYWINRHRYYELKHFCLQYPLWKHGQQQIRNYIGSHMGQLFEEACRNNDPFNDPIFNRAIKISEYERKIKLIEDSANETHSVIGDYILKGVTQGISYDILKLKYDVPCGKDYYYDLYRKFFYILDKKRA